MLCSCERFLMDGFLLGAVDSFLSKFGIGWAAAGWGKSGSVVGKGKAREKRMWLYMWCFVEDSAKVGSAVETMRRWSDRWRRYFSSADTIYVY